MQSCVVRVSVNSRCVPLRYVRVFSPSCIPGRGDPTQMDVGSNHAGAASTLTSMKSHGRDQVHQKLSPRTSGWSGRCLRQAGKCDGKCDSNGPSHSSRWGSEELFVTVNILFLMLSKDHWKLYRIKTTQLIRSEVFDLNSKCHITLFTQLMMVWQTHCE